MEIKAKMGVSNLSATMCPFLFCLVSFLAFKWQQNLTCSKMGNIQTSHLQKQQNTLHFQLLLPSGLLP